MNDVFFVILFVVATATAGWFLLLLQWALDIFMALGAIGVLFLLFALGGPSVERSYKAAHPGRDSVLPPHTSCSVAFKVCP